MIKIKICGITKLEDAQLAAQLGAWAVGFIFVKDSPRYIEPIDASKIISSLPQNIEKVGVFANSSLDEIIKISLESGITRIQLHGSESPEFCLELTNKTTLPLLKAMRVKNIVNIRTIQEYKNIISAILLDSFSEDKLGGTGKSFDWEIAKEAKSYNIPIILAGGLNPDNIREAYEQVKPYALDVSSGVEEEKGIKDHNKLKDLFSRIKYDA